jgi:hypothetical protein
MNLALTTPALATLAFGGLIIVGTIIEAVVTRKMPSLSRSALDLLVLLVVLPYTVNCLVVGECNWYAWLLVAVVTVPTLMGLVGIAKGRRREDEN